MNHEGDARPSPGFARKPRRVEPQHHGPARRVVRGGYLPATAHMLGPDSPVGVIARRFPAPSPSAIHHAAVQQRRMENSGSRHAPARPCDHRTGRGTPPAHRTTRGCGRGPSRPRRRCPRHGSATPARGLAGSRASPEGCPTRRCRAAPGRTERWVRLGWRGNRRGRAEPRRPGARRGRRRGEGPWASPRRRA